jgi:hypothetical protein
LSGGAARACLGHVSPEATEAGAMGLLKQGDRLRIDFPNRKIGIYMPETELAEQQSAQRSTGFCDWGGLTINFSPPPAPFATTPAHESSDIGGGQRHPHARIDQ